MTKKNYELIAKAFELQVSPLRQYALYAHSQGDMQEFKQWLKESNAIMSVAYNLAVALKQDNPNFDKDKFFDACGFTNDTILPR